MLFLNKPKHKEKVIATNRGWVVERTGEILVRVNNLDQKIKDFKTVFDNDIITSVVDTEQTTSETVLEAVEEQLEEKPSVDTSEEEVVVEQPTKRRGRKPKNTEGNV